MDRQKILIIFGAAWLSAALLTFIFIKQMHGPKMEATREILAVWRHLPLGTRIRKTDLKLIEVREKDIPKGALFQDKEALDRALLFPLNANEPLTNSKLASPGGADGIPSTIEAGMRAISGPVNDPRGDARRIQPHSRVDVLFPRPASIAEA